MCFCMQYSTNWRLQLEFAPPIAKKQKGEAFLESTAFVNLPFCPLPFTCWSLPTEHHNHSVHAKERFSRTMVFSQIINFLNKQGSDAE